MSAPEFTTQAMTDWLRERWQYHADASRALTADSQTYPALHHAAQVRLCRAIAARLSDPWSAFAGWHPPPEAERADGFRCLGLIPRHKEWLTIWWNVLPGGSSWWFRSRIVKPTAFAPLPPPPKES